MGPLDSAFLHQEGASCTKVSSLMDIRDYDATRSPPNVSDCNIPQPRSGNASLYDRICHATRMQGPIASLLVSESKHQAGTPPQQPLSPVSSMGFLSLAPVSAA